MGASQPETEGQSLVDKHRFHKASAGEMKSLLVELRMLLVRVKSDYF